MAWYNKGLRTRARKLIPSNLRSALETVGSDPPILLDWVNRGDDVVVNWGDAIAPTLVSFLSRRAVVNRRDILNPGGRTVYSGIGSMLGSVEARSWVVWGSGFIDSRAKLACKPSAICAVRGPLSREKLLDQGVNCPETYGDPGLLAPMLYQPKVRKDYVLGVIPHYKERNLPVLQELLSDRRVKIIDICSGITAVIDDINRCERIVSGSLHGLVCADAYSIPSRWIKLSDIPAGDGFKFFDYLAAVGRAGEEPILAPGSLNVEEIVKAVVPTNFQVDLRVFLSACPFLHAAHFGVLTGAQSWPLRRVCPA